VFAPAVQVATLDKGMPLGSTRSTSGVKLLLHGLRDTWPAPAMAASSTLPDLLWLRVGPCCCEVAPALAKGCISCCTSSN
jgi:hypothetical protein